MRKIFESNPRPYNIPIIAIVFDNDTHEIYAKRINSKLKKPKYKSHAEYLCLKDLEKINTDGKDLTVIISIPPCKNCTKILKKANINKVIFLSNYKQQFKYKFMNISKISYSFYTPINDIEKDIIKEITEPLKSYIDKSAQKSGNTIK